MTEPARRFDHIEGRRGGDRVVHVIQGEFATSADPDVVFSTLLGSCVAACLHDPIARVGGMNHFLLPEGSQAKSGAVSYGVNAMELLINDMLARGARRDRLIAKLFGGASMLTGVTDIGARNIAFIEKFLDTEKIDCPARSLGGLAARRVQFWPASGRARQLLLPDQGRQVFAEETKAAKKPAAAPVDDGAVELF
ncbi:MAG: chemotaxis protein CheD [Maricaulaceae bacterium]|jgi:chemotaxis protein CheD